MISDYFIVDIYSFSFSNHSEIHSCDSERLLFWANRGSWWEPSTDAQRLCIWFI